MIVREFNERLRQQWATMSPRFLPFADAATKELPLGRLLRLSLFQVTVGMAIVLVLGTLNRVMIVELGVPATLVALMISLPLFFAPFRALVGFRSDTHRSYLGWRRVPYLVIGSMLQFGGFSIMPFALLLLSGDTHGPMWVGHVAAAAAFLLVGAGLHTVQTAGLALATDLAPAHARPKVVALLCAMLLAGMLISALAFGYLLHDFTPLKLIQVIQGAAVVTVALNSIALWKQEPRQPNLTRPDIAQPSFRQSWQTYLGQTEKSKRRLLAIGLGTAAFSMADVLLEPFGGQILHLSVGATTALTAAFAAGSAAGLWLAARILGQGADPFRVAAYGAIIGLAGFSCVIFCEPFGSAGLFAIGTALIGFGGGLFAHGTLTASMAASSGEDSGMALGAWGSAQATAAGLAIALGGALRDAVTHLTSNGAFGEGFTGPATGYIFVYHVEILLLFITLIALGPLVHTTRRGRQDSYSATRTGRPARLISDHLEVTMQTGALTSYLDVAQLTLYVFWLFFAGLILYIRREDRREGYPLVDDITGKSRGDDFILIPEPKSFKLANGATVTAPNTSRDDNRPVKGTKTENWYGAPLVPTGNPYTDSIGPGSYAERSDTPDVTYQGANRIVPMRLAAGFSVVEEDIDPRGLPVYGADGVQGGTVKDVWIDRSEYMIRYLEVETTGNKRVLLPINFTSSIRGVDIVTGIASDGITVNSILGSQFAGIPATKKS